MSPTNLACGSWQKAPFVPHTRQDTYACLGIVNALGRLGGVLCASPLISQNILFAYSKTLSKHRYIILPASSLPNNPLWACWSLLVTHRLLSSPPSDHFGPWVPLFLGFTPTVPNAAHYLTLYVPFCLSQNVFHGTASVYTSFFLLFHNKFFTTFLITFTSLI